MKVPSKGQKTYFDDALPGFGVRISQGGSKSFVVMYGPKRNLKTLGRYPAISLADARREAKRIQSDVPDLVGLPNPEKSVLFDEARSRFLRDAQRRNKPRTVADYHRLLHRHFNFSKSIGELTRANVMRVIEKLADTPSEQRHAFLAIRTMLNWCVKRGYLEATPVPSISFRTESRNRILSDDELRVVWDRANQYGYPYGTILQLLILTGQRKGEIAHLRWEWIEDNTVIFPEGFTKNKREHRIPLGNMAQKLIATIPQKAPLLFPSRLSNEKPFNGWSKCKRAFDLTINIEPYTQHDLRRTFSSIQAKIDTPIHITEKLLNHVSGTVSGVAAIYNRHTYADEMKNAIGDYETYLSSVLSRS